MDQKIINNYLQFLHYTQQYYENKFKFVPLTQTKQCFVKGHTKVEVGLWNSRDVNLNTTVNEFNKLSNDIHGIGIHSSPDVVILDIDSIVNEDGTHKKLTEVQKDYLINKFQTLAQKTKGGVHLFFNNDIDIKVATTGLNFDFGNSKIKYDVRGVGKAYIGIKDIVNGFSLNELKQISTFKNIFNLESKQEQKKKEYLIDDEKLSEFFEIPSGKVYEEDEKKFYGLENVINGRNLKQLEEENFAEGNRYPTFTQIALRGARIGVNYNVIQDIILKMNSNLSEALNQKRLDGVFKITDQLISNYSEYEQKRTNTKQSNILPNLRMKVSEVKQLNNSYIINGFTSFKNNNEETIFTNYEILVNEINHSIKKDCIVDLKISECNFKTNYEVNGEIIELKHPKYKGKALNCELVTDKSANKLFGLSVSGNFTGKVKEDKYYKFITLIDNDNFIKLTFDKEIELQFSNNSYQIPLSNFKTTKNEEGKYYSTGKLSKYTINSLEKFSIKEVELKEEITKTSFDNTDFNNEILKEEINNTSFDSIEFNNEILNQEPPVDIYNYYDSNINNSNENVIKENKEFKPQLPNLRMKVSEVKKLTSFYVIKGFVARKNKSTNDFDFTNYEVIVPDLKQEIKPKDVVDIDLKKLEYKPEYINQNGEKVKFKNPNFSATGINVMIKNDNTKEQMLGASICGNLENKNGKLTIKNEKTDVLTINDKLTYPSFESKNVTLPITTYKVNFKEKTTYCGINKNLTIDKILRFERTGLKNIEKDKNFETTTIKSY